MLDVYSCSDTLSELAALKKQGWQIIGLENNISSNKLVALNDKRLSGMLSDKVELVLGEEVHGISNSLHDIIDLFVEIPMKGQKESFNVSVAAGIALYGLNFP